MSKEYFEDKLGAYGRNAEEADRWVMKCQQDSANIIVSRITIQPEVFDAHRACEVLRGKKQTSDREQREIVTSCLLQSRKRR